MLKGISMPMKPWIAAAFAAIALGAALAAAGCERPENRAGADGARNTLTIKGSDTMVNLVTAWAEDFMAGNPGVRVTTVGGGSGTGFASMLNNTTDICASSRSIMPNEIERMQERGIEVAEHKVGLDGLAIVVHPSNPVEQLSMEQLKGIYTGTITDWSEVGGEAGRIVAVSRDSASGTFLFFAEVVLQRQDYATTVMPLISTAGIAQQVATNPRAIGYVGLAYAENANVRIVPIQLEQGAEAVMPTEENVRSGAYPIARPLFLYTDGDPESGIVRDFLDFVMTPAGARITSRIGYVPLIDPGQE